MSLYEQARELVAPRDTFMKRLDLTLRSHDRTHADLARAAKVDPALLSRWFTGQKQPGLESMLRLEDAIQRVLYGGE
jgi:transcriptional regulator with XRE-family HTH domain